MEEGSEVGVGGIVEDAESGMFEYFGCAVSDGTIRDWKRAGGKGRVIHQAEVLPAALAMEIWGPRLRNRKVVVFVDNDAARDALVKGATTSKASAALVSKFWDEVAAAGIYVWIDRVASKSNPADGPSRGARRGIEEARFPGG